jgi:tellurite resistance protein TerC
VAHEPWWGLAGGLLAQVAPANPAPPHFWHWIAFAAFVTVVLTLDLLVFHRHSKESTLREAAAWTVAWCSLALAFNGLVWFWLGRRPAVEFLTGYIIEWSLSMDNVFVFAVVFSFFGVPRKYQYRVLFWGILGAVLMRLTFVLLGSALISRFGWVLPIFGLFLIYTGFKLAFQGDSEVHPEKNWLMRLARRLFPVAHGDHGERFFVRDAGKLSVTPLFLVLLVIESTDVVFAVDSVPAIFGITRDPFIVFTSNIFAILGLRALYFLLAGVMDMFRYLKYGLAAVLVFVGMKMTADAAVTMPAVRTRLPAAVQAYIDHHTHAVPDGYIDRSDVQQWFGGALHPDPVAPWDPLSAADADRDGRVNLQEAPEPLRVNFAWLDADGDDAIDQQDLRRALGGPEATMGDLGAVLQQADRDGDGRLAPAETHDPLTTHFALADVAGNEQTHLIPAWASLAVVLSLLGAAVVASLIAARVDKVRAGRQADTEPKAGADEPEEPTNGSRQDA